MPDIFNEKLCNFVLHAPPISELNGYNFQISEIVKSKHMSIDIRSLESDKFSFPYHFHYNAEEVFVILSGSATLRTPDGFKVVSEGDIIFMEMGATSAHQLYNHTLHPCRYLDIRTTVGLDLCEYPDSQKVNMIPYNKIFDSSSEVNYFKNEDKIREKWPQEIVNSNLTK